MTDELLFSVLGLTMDGTNTNEIMSPTVSAQPAEYETPCTIPYNDHSEVIDRLISPSTDSVECYTDLTYSPEMPWSDWTTTNIAESSVSLNEFSALDTEFDWCLDKTWNSGLPERTPMCTPGCERFLHLPLPKPSQQPQQIFQHDEPLLVLGIDLRSLENSLSADFNNNQLEESLLLSTSANAALATHDYTNRSLDHAPEDRCFPCTYQGCLKVSNMH